MAFRYTLRVLARNPGFAALSILSLAVGIGVTTAVASLADAILFRPLPVPAPNEVVRVFTASPGAALGFVSYPDYRDLRDHSQTLSGLITETQVMPAVRTGNGAPEIRMGLSVSTNYFDVLGVSAALGRTFRPEESHQAVMVLADGFWRSRFGASGNVLGRTVRVGNRAFIVIGVAPTGFGLDRFLHEDFYLPIEFYGSTLGNNPLEDRGKRFLTVRGRLARGTTPARAQAEFTHLAARLAQDFPATNQGRHAIVLTELASRMRTDRSMPALSAIFLAVGVLVLGIACTNVTGLLLMRAEAREREIAVRMAVGSGTARLLLQSLMESLMLAAAGAILGIPIAWGALQTMASARRCRLIFRFQLRRGSTAEC